MLVQGRRENWGQIEEKCSRVAEGTRAPQVGLTNLLSAPDTPNRVQDFVSRYT